MLMKKDDKKAANSIEQEACLFQGDDIRPFVRSLPMSLLVARESVMKAFRLILKEYNLNEHEWRILRALVEVESLEIGELADKVLMQRSSLTRTLKNMQTRRLISRKKSKTDQRYFHISITQTGHRLFHKAAPHSEQEYNHIKKVFGTKKLEQLYSLLNELSEKLEKE